VQGQSHKNLTDPRKDSGHTQTRAAIFIRPAVEPENPHFVFTITIRAKSIFSIPSIS